MPAPLTIQLNIRNGAANEEGPYARVVQLSGAGEGDCLLLVAEARGPDGAEVCDNALDYLTRAFAGGTLSISRRLLDGLKGVHTGLATDNRTSLPQHRVTLGVVLAFLRGEDLYLAQAGAPAVYLMDEEGAHLLTPPAPDGAAEDLGGERSPQLIVRRQRLQPGSRVLLLAGAPNGNGCEPAVVRAFGRGVEDGMVAVYRQAREARSLGALALEMPGGTPRVTPAVRYGGAIRTGPRPTYRTVEPDELEPLPMETPGRGISIDLRPPPIRVPNPLNGVVPPQAMVVGAVLFVLVGLGLLGRACVDQSAQDSRQQVQALVQGALDTERKANEATTADKRRELLTQAISPLDTALQRNPALTDAQTALDRIRRSLTDLDAIRQLDDLRTVADLGQAAGGTVLARDIVATSAGLMLLDRGGDRVLQVAPGAQQGDGKTTTVSVFSASPPRGRRNLSHLTWMPRAGTWPRDSLLALDDNRALTELTAGNDPRQLALRGATDWESVQAMTSYNGVLYILDPKASQVWRYVPSDSGFDSERRPALPSLDLRDAQDLVVDGDFYVLVKTGKILKVSNGRAVAFPLDGLDRPLLSPSALATTTDMKTLFVVDQGNKRIVEFDKANGKFRRQFPLGDLPPVHALWVDQDTSTLYLVSDRLLHAATLPKG